MPNIADHAAAIGELSLIERPFDALDALILSQLVYLPMEGYLDRGESRTVAQAWDFLSTHVCPDEMDRFQKKRCLLFERCAGLKRYRNWEMRGYVNHIDREAETQFCACTFVLPESWRVIAFRGTDLTIAGWKEDLNMAYMTVPAQREAEAYVTQAAQEGGAPLLLCGHSKGGNLALYAGSAAEGGLQEDIRRIYTFDGPGVDQKTLEGAGYRSISARVESYIPQSSVVGVLLHYHPAYTVVKSDAYGILQHDALTWQVEAGDFVRLSGLDAVGSITDETMNEWLAQMDLEERRLLVDTLYRVVDAADAELVTDLSDDWLTSIGKMLEAIRSLTPEVKREVVRMVHELFSTGAGEVVRHVVQGVLQLRRGETGNWDGRSG